MPDTLDADSHIPRWRRPSVQSARKERRGVEVAHVPVAFTDEQPTGERRRVRYRLVRVLSIPDEILGEEVALLDQGDEVELVRSTGAYRLIRTPYGQEGWVHQMTLESGPPEPDDASPPTTTRTTTRPSSACPRRGCRRRRAGDPDRPAT